MASSDYSEVLEANGPTVDTFFRGEPHWSSPPDADVASIEAVEARLGIELPGLLKQLYLRGNGGGTDFTVTPITAEAPLDAGDDSGSTGGRRCRTTDSSPSRT